MLIRITLLIFILFQSTHPVRGGTFLVSVAVSPALISIHPPREGWDMMPLGFIFSPFSFQSTHPVRGGTGDTFKMRMSSVIHFNPPTP